MNIQENVSLAALTTFKVGGVARYLLKGESAQDIEAAKKFSEEKGIPFIVLGGGSNTLADDGMMDAAFYVPQNTGISIEEKGSGCELVVGSAEVWDDVVACAVDRELYGFENLSGIPGSVGGAAVQNIGAYGAVLSNSVSWVEAYDFSVAAMRVLSVSECQYGYRSSIFKQDPYRFVVTRVGFLLQKEGIIDISYKDLQEMFKEAVPTLVQTRVAVLSIRARKFPDLSVEGTAGSFFKNPIVSKEDAAALKERFPGVPLYSVPEERGVKVPLAWFLDRILNLRGFTKGSVRCFEAQPLVLVASGESSAEDVRALAFFVQQEVKNKIGITISPEVCILRNNILTSKLDF